MRLIQAPRQEELGPCPYLTGRERKYESFFAGQVSADELAFFLNAGWRKFGHYYFRPVCPACERCIPLRVPTTDFVPSRSQRRVLRANRDLRTVFGPLKFSDKIFSIYRSHSRERFSDDPLLEDFLFNFYMPSCPVLQSEFYLGEELVGVGFLDRGSDSLSSVYFCFDPRFSARNLGTFSILQEIFRARDLGLKYYYLGYYVLGCSRVAYKDHFRPREWYQWQENRWGTKTGPPGSGSP